MASGMQWHGVREFTALLTRLEAQLITGLARGLYEEGLLVLHRSNYYTPVEYGTLRSSGHVELPKISVGQIEVIIGYGGAAAPYAIYVHERTELRHKPPTRAKFLETAVLEASPGWANRLAARVRMVVR